MAVNIGQINMQMIADTRRFRNEIKTSRESVERFGGGMDRTERSSLNMVRGIRVAVATLGVLKATIAVALRSTINFADEMDKMAIRTGIAVEELQELSFAFNILGADIGIAERAVTALTSNLVDNARESNKTGLQIRRLGIELRTQEGLLRDTGDLFFETIERLSQLESATERTALATTLFGRGVARELLPVLEASGGQIAHLRRVAADLGLVVDRQTIDVFVRAKDELTVLQSVFQGLTRDIATLFLPFALILADVAFLVIMRVREWISQNEQLVRILVVAAGVVLLVVGGFAALGAGLKIVTSVLFFALRGFMAVTRVLQLFLLPLKLITIGLKILFAPIATATRLVMFLGRTFTGILAIGGRVALFFVRTLPAALMRFGMVMLRMMGPIGLIITAAMLLHKAWQANWFGIRDVVTAIWENHLQPTFEVIKDAIKTFLEDPLFHLKNAWETIWGGIVSIAQDSWALIKATWELLKEGYQTFIEDPLGTIQSVWQSIWDGIVTALDTSWQIIESTFSLVKDWLSNVLINAVTAFKDMWTTAWDAVGAALSTVWGITQAVISGIVDWIGDRLTHTIEAFGRLWDTVWGGVKSTAQTVWEGIKNVAQPVIDLITGFIDSVRQRLSFTMDFSFPGLDTLINLFDSVKGFGGAVLDLGVRTISGILNAIGLNQGGILPGFGRRDTIPAMLTPGEAVVPAPVVRQGIGAILEWFRRMGINTGIMQLAGSPVGNPNGPNGLLNGNGIDVDTPGWFARTLTRLGVSADRTERFMENFRVALGLAEGDIDTAMGDILDFTGGIDRAAREPISALQFLKESVLGLVAELPLVKQSLETFRDVLDQTRSRSAAFSGVVLGLITQSQTFQNLLNVINPVLTAVADALGMIIRPILPIVQIMQMALLPVLQMLATIIGTILMPIFQALFPIIKFFGQVLLGIARVVAQVWNSLLDLISIIPFVNLRRYKISLEDLDEAQRKLAETTFDDALAMAEHTEEVQRSMEALRGVPATFRLVQRRMEAVIAPTPGLAGAMRSPNPGPIPGGNSSSQVTVNVNGGAIFTDQEHWKQEIQDAVFEGQRRGNLSKFGLSGAS
jgi:phage-related protein